MTSTRADWLIFLALGFVNVVPSVVGLRADFPFKR
jgi:hypothetical protein